MEPEELSSEKSNAEKEVQSSKKSSGANVQSSDEAQRRRGAEAQKRKAEHGRKGADAKTGRILCEERKEVNVGTRWEARCYTSIESEPRRLRVVAIATHRQPTSGAHLAPLTPLTRAAHARDCTRNARTQQRLRSNPQARGA